VMVGAVYWFVYLWHPVVLREREERLVRTHQARGLR